MQKLLDLIQRVMLYASALSTFVIMLLTTIDAMGRYLFNSPIAGVYEITTSYLMVAAVFLGATYAYREGAYIRVTFLAERLPGKVKLAVDYFVQTISMLYGALLVYATYEQMLVVMASHTVLSSVEGVSLWPAYVIVPLGLCLMSLDMLFDLSKVKTGDSPLFKADAPTI
jgi:TRAP-type C4-dicarboxylate transport system permease small subunit